MAESIISDIAVELISKLGSFAFNEIGVCWGLKDELEKLRRTVGTIEAVLLHAEEQSVENPQVKHWLGFLSEALYDADDLLDEFSTEALRQQVMGGSEFSKKVRLFFSSSNQLAFGLKMGHRVKALRERLDEIAAEKNKFHLESRPFVERRFVSKVRDQTHSSPSNVVIGREDDKELIVELLLSSDCVENVSVVSIVGIGGLGKTTLAQMVYNDDRVKNHFELKMWVCVSDDFDVQLLVKNVVESASGMAPSSTQMDVLKNRLHENINGRRYLLVLDDVWNQDVNRWSNFKEMLDGGARGSKIVITTRLRTVAEMSRPIIAHELSGLSENESWSLFKQVAFKQEQLPNSSLEAMGKEIVSKCCGVPLAIKTIGGMLYFKDSESEWLSFKDKELSAIDVYKNDILPILKLSYNHLPSHYKRCIAYCSLYPKDFRICVEELIHLWKAQGYLKSANSNECLYDVGFGYFMDLFKLSFFQDVERNDYGNIEFCKMHDLVHDLAIAVAGENIYASHSPMTSIINNAKHVSFKGYQNCNLGYVSSLFGTKNIRTILSLWEFTEHSYEAIDAVFCNLRNLRMVDLSMTGIDKLPNSIHKLKHLRYLDLSHNIGIKNLPKSITKLQNLQVLKLERCGLVQLPSNITKLVNLTDLDNADLTELRYMPRGIGKLTQLEKLSEFVIAKDRSISKNIGELDELHSLNNLRGRLEIKNLKYLKKGTSECIKAHLNLKQKLQMLTLNWGDNEGEDDDGSTNDVANAEMVMEALCPHPNSKELAVWYYGGVKPPSWLPCISSLVSVTFDFCKRIKWLPPFDQLVHLRKLEITCLTELEHIDVENRGGSSSFFPSLTDLTVFKCPKFKGFESLSSFSMEQLPCFPRLSELYISGCPNLTYFPRFPELKVLNSDGNRIEILLERLKMKTSSPFCQLQYLTFVSMKDSLESELLQYLPSLRYLRFSRCSFRNVSNDAVQWQSLKFLRSIGFYATWNLVALPKGLQYVTTLQHLEIYDCPSLECLPDWMPELVSLQDLTIRACPQLEERFENNMAEDWPKISHIPNVHIGNKTIQRNGRYLL